MRVRLLSRASDLARLQAMLVADALRVRWPDLDVVLATRVAAGDRDTATPLTALVDKGAFTADLSDALALGEADAVVHSWKDLPLEDREHTTIAATLERADPRDVLLVRREVLVEKPRVLKILSSSPRRGWLLQDTLPALLPWPVDALEFVPVRGNIATRMSKLAGPRAEGAHALVVAKAALDRLLGSGAPFETAVRDLREMLARCAWTVLPIREVPGAPAQGALAVETPREGPVFERVRAISHEPTWRAVMAEREVLASYGGGCHQPLGATVLPREYGQIVSVRGRRMTGERDDRWTLAGAGALPPPAQPDRIWPRPEERHRAARHGLHAVQPADDAGYWVARAEALPNDWTITSDRLVWAAGSTTWRRLAARGVWVNGCAEGLGDPDAPAIEHLAGRAMTWHRLTHARADADDPAVLPTYAVDDVLPDDLPARTHFFWTSGTLLRDALRRWPEIRGGWHASGPGRTWRAVSEALGADGRARVWLEYEDWRRDVVERTA